MNLRILLPLLALMWAALCGPAQAESRKDLLDALAGCAGKPDAAERLSCYDGLAGRVEAARAEEESGESIFGFDFLFGSDDETKTAETAGASADVATGPRTPEQEFGAERLPQVQEERKRERLESISSPVKEYAFTPFKKFIVVLENGQVWRQIDSDSGKAQFKREPGENSVTISRGAMWSYNLQINDSKKIYKVKRVE